MRHILPVAVSVLLLCVAASQLTPDGDAAAPESQREGNTPAQAAKKRDPSIDIVDLLEALNMQMWKARVNDAADQRIKIVTLSIKQQQSDPKTVLTLDIPDGGPGTLLVYLQDLRNQRCKVGIVYHGDNSRSGSTSNIVDDPFTEVVGIWKHPSAAIGRRGVTVLRSNSNFDISNPETVAIFLNHQ
jgi:hypothetical protein